MFYIHIYTMYIQLVGGTSGKKHRQIVVWILCASSEPVRLVYILQRLRCRLHTNAACLLNKCSARCHICIFMHFYTSTNKCKYELFVVHASRTHELKANARVNTCAATTRMMSIGAWLYLLDCPANRICLTARVFKSRGPPAR